MRWNYPPDPAWNDFKGKVLFWIIMGSGILFLLAQGLCEKTY